MTSLTIGRAGRASEGHTISNVESVTHSDNDTITFSGRISCRDKEHVTLLRDQLLGHVDSIDEPYVPVTYSTDPSINGFYKVISASIDVDDPGGYKIGWWPYSVTLERPKGYGSPVFESHLVGSKKVNDHGINSPYPWHAVPIDAYGYDYGKSAGTEEARYGEDGGVRWRHHQTLFNAIASWEVDPETYYQGSCKIKQRRGIENQWWTVTGRRPRRELAEGFMLDNGLVRVSYGQHAGMLGEGASMLTVQHFRGLLFEDHAWQPHKQYTLTTTDKGEFISWRSMRIVKNSPDEVIVSFNIALWPNEQHPVRTLYLSLKRGSYWVYGYVVSDGLTRWRLRRTLPEAGRATTAGIEANSLDAYGNRYQLITTEAHTKQLASGGMDANINDLGIQWDFGIGMTFGSVGGFMSQDAQMRQYMVTMSERVEPVFQ